MMTLMLIYNLFYSQAIIRSRLLRENGKYIPRQVRVEFNFSPNLSPKIIINCVKICSNQYNFFYYKVIVIERLLIVVQFSFFKKIFKINCIVNFVKFSLCYFA